MKNFRKAMGIGALVLTLSGCTDDAIKNNGATVNGPYACNGREIISAGIAATGYSYHERIPYVSCKDDKGNIIINRYENNGWIETTIMMNR